MHILMFVLSLAVVTTPCHANAAEPLPLERVGRSFAVGAVINGKKISHMVIDSGASLAMISEKTAVALGLEVNGALPRVPLSTPSGETWVRLVMLDTVQVGPVVMHNVETAVSANHMKNADGTLGSSFFDGLVYSINSREKQIRVRLSESDGPVYGGFDEQWWRRKFERYTHAIQRYEQYGKRLSSAMVVEGKSMADQTFGFTEENLRQLVKFYRQLYQALDEQATAFDVPDSWRSQPR